MFTGIVEEIGKIISIKPSSQFATLRIVADKVLQDTQLGDSICTNGVCLTVTKLLAGAFEVDVTAGTLKASNLGELKTGDAVHLERALTLNTRLGGHIVSGHIDGVGHLVHKSVEGHTVWLTIRLPKELMPYVISKGSIALDGVSLTIAELLTDGIKVAIIPHTQQETLLLQHKVGSSINVECDQIGKYVARLMQYQTEQEVAPTGPKQMTLTEVFLAENGFM